MSGRVGRGAADAQLFELAHQARLVVAGRVLREALLRRHLAGGELRPPLHGGQGGGIVALGLVVGGLAVHAQEPVEHHDLARGHELVLLPARADGDDGLFQFRVGHLGGDGALPHQLVEALLLGVAPGGVDVHVGGADGLVRFLRPLGVGGEAARVHVLFTHRAGYFVARGGQGEVGQVDGVGTHVGDFPVLVEPLRQRHRLRHGVAQLAGGLLLQRGGGEGGGGRLLHGARHDVLDGEPRRAARLEEVRCLLLGGEARVQLRPQLGGVAVLVRSREEGRHAVGRLGAEVLYLALALHDEAHGHRLHAPGRERGSDLAPQHGRELEAHDAVEHAACLLRVDQVEVDVARVLDGGEDGGLGDFVEHDAARAFGLQPQHLVQVPGDGFPLAVLIGGQPHHVGLPGGLLQLGHELLLIGRHLVLRRVAVLEVDVDAPVGQVAHVPEAGHHVVVLPQEFLDGLGLGGRLDDDKILRHILYNV